MISLHITQGTEQPPILLTQRPHHLGPRRRQPAQPNTLRPHLLQEPHRPAVLRLPLHHDLTLVQYPAEALSAPETGRPGNLQQFAFHVASEDAVEAAYEAVTAAGVTIVSPLERGPVLGILQFYMADPDGNKVENFHTPGLAPRPERSVESPGLIRVDFLSHIGVYAGDMEKSIDWYEEMLGFRLSDKRGAGPPEPSLQARLPPRTAPSGNPPAHPNPILVHPPAAPPLTAPSRSATGAAPAAAASPGVIGLE